MGLGKTAILAGMVVAVAGCAHARTVFLGKQDRRTVAVALGRSDAEATAVAERDARAFCEKVGKSFRQIGKNTTSQNIHDPKVDQNLGLLNTSGLADHPDADSAYEVTIEFACQS